MPATLANREEVASGHKARVRPGALLCLALLGCGGGGSPTVAPTPAPTPIPPVVVLQETFDLEAEYAYGWYFDTTGPGTIDITIDYTFPDSTLAIWVARGTCTFDNWLADACEYVATSFAGPQPRKVSATAQPAGSYSMIIWNVGPNNESLSFQVVSTRQPSASTASSARPRAAPGLTGWISRVARR